MTLGKLLLSLYFLLLSFGLFAQKPHIRIYSIQEGLPQSSVYALFLDHQSKLWVGTQGGVASFNGKEFTTYTQKEGLGDNHVTQIFQDHKNRIWLGHRYSGVSLEKGDKFENFLADTIKDVNTIIQNAQDELLIGTDNGLFILDVNSGDLIAHHLQNYLVRKLVHRAEDILLAGTKGLHRISTKKDKIETETIVPISELNTSANAFIDVVLEDEGKLWVATTNEIFQIDISDEQNPKLLQSYTNKDIKYLEAINTIYLADDKALWIGTDEGAIRIIDDKVEFFGVENGLSGKQVTTINQDHEKQIWIGTHMGKGLSLFLGRYFEQINQKEDEIVLSITTDNQGAVWAGTLQGAFRYIFSDEYQSNIKQIEKINAFPSVPNAPISALYTDTRGLVWIGTDGKLASYDPKTGKITDYTSRINIHPKAPVISISEDKSNNIWISSFGLKCVRLKLEDSRLIAVDDFTTAEGLTSNVIWKIFRDSKGNLWFGSNDNGLSVYDGESFKNISTEQGLPHNRPAAITEDASGNLWFASIGGGIFKYDGQSYDVYTTKEGIGSDNPYLVLGDDDGNIWVGTNKGVDKLNPSTGEVLHYGFKEGFIGTEANQNAAYKDKNGNLWFGTINGLMKANPDLFFPSEIAPPIFIENVQLFLRDTINLTGQTLPHHQNYLTFNFEGISYKNPEKLRYQYRLKGLDTDWSPPITNNLATYTSLPDGDYTFEVKAINASGVPSSKLASTSFAINPPFWKELWFQILAGLVVFLFVWGGHHLRMRKIRNDKIHLEKMVEIRTEEISAQQEQIKSYNESLIERNAEIMQQKEEILTQRDDIHDKAQQLSLVYQESEQQNLKISQSIRYAQRIQRAMLPSERFLKKLLPESFVFYQPKDVVSGDSYWVGKTANKILVAGIDCTGHGVPGAIMSMAANSALTQIIEAEGEWQPNKILSRLHHLIRHNLSQSETNIKDGMDIAICAISKEDNQLYFAGAKRPLIYFQNEELKSIRGDRHSIGGVEEDLDFTLHQIDYSTQNSFYLTSDGYQDQFGGKSGKRMGRNGFYKLLHEAVKKPISEQESFFANFMDKWKSDAAESQIDDQLIFGFRVV